MLFAPSRGGEKRFCANIVHVVRLVLGGFPQHMAAMPRLQFQVKIFFLVLFAFLVAGLYGYDYLYVKPARECEEAGKWWYGPNRECAQPVKISDLTGRHMDEPMPGSAEQLAADQAKAGLAPSLTAQAPAAAPATK